ncbi:MAG TPA: hypothetical protein PLZ95_01865 [Bryobacteraceae bacterium]|nr:hypothetical protein [Bryobacteraceae bacterium]
MTTTGTGSSSLSTFLEDAGCCRAAVTEESESVSFQEYVEEAASDGTAATEGSETTTESVAASVCWASSDPETEQVSQNGTQSMASQLSSTAATYSAAATADATTAEDTAEDPSIKAVRDAMAAAGLDPDSVKMTYHTEDVWFPAGGWVNEMLLIETADGKSLDFSARLTERSPEVTVCDVRHMLEGTGGWATLS